MKSFLLTLALCLAPLTAWAEPPKLVIPAEVKVTSRFVEVLPKDTDAASITYISLDGVVPIPTAWSSNPLALRFDAESLPAGRYKFIAIAASKTGEQTRADFAAVKGTPPPAIPVPPVTPPITPPVTPPVTVKATAVTYVYEKDQHALPSPVLAALNKINREKGVIATVFEIDTKSGTREIPAQYRATVAAAQQVGLPVLIVQAGDKVLKSVKDPKTEASVLENVP